MYVLRITASFRVLSLGSGWRRRGYVVRFFLVGRYILHAGNELKKKSKKKNKKKKKKSIVLYFPPVLNPKSYLRREVDTILGQFKRKEAINASQQSHGKIIDILLRPTAEDILEKRRADGPSPFFLPGYQRRG